MFDKPFSTTSAIYWIMAAIVGVIKFIESYRSTGERRGDGLLASADGLTAIVMWWALSASAVALWAVVRASKWGKDWGLPDFPEPAWSAVAMLVALAGVRKLMAFSMRFHFVRDKIDDEKPAGPA